MDAQLSQKLERVRSQLNSKLENQSSVAKTLVAVEDVLREQGIAATPTAYLVTLLSLLGSSVSADVGQVNYPLAAPVLYLLDLVLPSIPPQTLRTYYLRTIPGLLAVLDVAPTTAHTEGSTAVARSTIGAIETLLLAQDYAAWTSREENSVHRVFTGYIMGSATDVRPKVRKRALEAVKTVLQNRPANPNPGHPAAEESAMIAFHGVEGHFGARKKGKDGAEREVKGVHSLHLLKVVASAVSWPKGKIREFVELLLKLSSELYDDIVRLSALEVFQVIFAQASGQMDANRLKEVLEIIMSNKPEKKDSQLLPSWLAIIAAGYNVYARLDADSCLQSIPPLLRQIFPFLQSEVPSVRDAVGSTLVALCENCLSKETAPEIADEVLQVVAEIAMQGLTTRYQLAWREVFRFVGALFLSLRAAANPLFLDTVKIVEGMRATEGFEGKAEAEAVIGAAITGVGPEAVLKVLPLNLENQGPRSPGRAWLLPILKASVRNTQLAHFSSYFVPLSERLYQRVLATEKNKTKTMEVKILETMIEQIWALLPGYCEVPTDLTKAFNQPFAELLANVLYQQVNLRPVVCHALKNLVQENVRLLDIDFDDMEMMQAYRLTEDEVRQSLDLMASLASNFLSILFNVFSQTTPSYRSPITECIKAFLGIASEKDRRETLEKVGELLKQNLAHPQPAEKSELPTLAQTAVDLILIMIPHLPAKTYEILWAELDPLLKSKDDPNMQRRAYRCLAKLAESPSGKEFLVNRIDQITDILKTTDTHPTAQKDRILALAQVVEILPPQSLHMIPTVLPEAVIATKEKNEKARDAAYNLLITMGKKMQGGGTVKNAMVDGMGEDSGDATASIGEYFLMVSAGLAGSSQHMISATITALSRMLYEFKDDLSPELVDDLLATMEVFLTSRSREIARSAIGFIKVALVTLPKVVLEKRLEKLIPNLMVWSHESKGHFRIKVKTLMDRMMRKFGYDTLVQYTPEDDHKLLINIRKTRDRKKRGKQAGKEDEVEEETAKPTTGQSAYDAILNESDSDLDFPDLEEELNKAKDGKSKKKGRQQETFIREDSEEPIDLLSQNAFAHVTAHQPPTHAERSRRVAKAASRASTFKSTAQGRMIFEDPQVPGKGKQDKEAVAEYNAYEEAQDSRDMAKRGFRDRVKFSNKRSRQDAEGFVGDVEMTDAYAEEKTPPMKKTVRFDGRQKGGAFQYRRPT